MAVELLIASPDGKKIQSPVIEEGIEWSTERRSTPGKLTFKVVKDNIINFQEGAAVRLKVDGNPIFFGFVFSKKRDKDQIITVTAYDQLRYLNNKDTYVYENKTASQFIQMIAADFSLKLGTVENTKFMIASRVEDNTSIFDMVENALDLTLQNSKEMFVLYDDFGKLMLKNISSMYVEKSGNYLMIDEETGENFEYTSSIDSDTYNKIKLTYDNEETGKREVYIAQDSKHINEWGVILYIELDNIIKEAYGDTASREFLIKRCKERGITPYEATKTVLKGKFTPTNIDVTGRRFNIGTMNFIVLEKITDGEYQVQCETSGIIGNQYLGSMMPIEYIDGLETAELTEILIPGEDEEDTEILRQRYFDSFNESAFGGNVYDYLKKTNAIQGVGSTKVTRVWNSDLSPSDMIPSESVKTWYEEIIGTLTSNVSQWLTTMYTAAKEKNLTTGGTVLVTILDSDFGVASDTLIQRVQETLDPESNAGGGWGLAPIGHVVKVKSADSVPITVNTTLIFDGGYSWSNLQNTINNVISDYLFELRKEWADEEYLIIRKSQIETRLLSVKGISDIDNTKINGSEDNLTLGKYEVPVFGGASE